MLKVQTRYSSTEAEQNRDRRPTEERRYGSLNALQSCQWQFFKCCARH